MKALLERELKLAPPPGLDLSALEGDRGPTRILESTYYDTVERSLLRRGVTLRRRVEGEDAVWQLKLPSAGDRMELELPAPDESPPEELLSILLALTRRRPVEPVARLRTSRETLRVLRSDDVVAEIALDAVSVLEDDRVVAAFDELEIELVDGSPRDLRKLGKMLRSVGATDAPGTTKLARALGVAEPEPRPEASGKEPAELLIAALRAQLERILDHDPGTRAGVDAEELHQFRVATRRLRAFLRTGADLLDPEWAATTRAELGWLGGLLGGVRDLDVLIDHIRRQAETLEADEREAIGRVLGALDSEREGARGRLLEGLSSDRYLALLDRLEERPLTTEEQVTLPRLWRGEHRRAERAVERLGALPPDDELHDVRIRVKRARYAAELAGPTLGKGGTRFVDLAKRFQDVLGDHQDSVVVEAALRRHATNAVTALAAGRLIERERARRATARADWRPAWDALARCATRLRA